MNIGEKVSFDLNGIIKKGVIVAIQPIKKRQVFIVDTGDICCHYKKKSDLRLIK